MFVKISLLYYLTLLISFDNCVGNDNSEPKFRVLTQNELMVRVPPQEDNAKLILLRISVIQNNVDDIEIGDNFIKDDQVHIFDKRLRLKGGDVVNYLLGFRSDQGYRALTGKYIFDGEYKHPSRLRRNADASTEDSTSTSDEEDSGEEGGIESRFGGGRGHRHYHNHHHGNNWGRGPPGLRYPHQPPFNPFGHGPPPYGGPHNNPYWPKGPFGVNCNDHTHDICHNHNNNNNNNNGNDVEVSTTTPRTSTSPLPDIDIRFAD